MPAWQMRFPGDGAVSDAGKTPMASSASQLDKVVVGLPTGTLIDQYPGPSRRRCREALLPPPAVAPAPAVSAIPAEANTDPIHDDHHEV
jgi:hypothetical protein